VYVPHEQNPSPATTFVIRTGADPASFAAAVRERLRSVDSSQPIYNVRPAQTLLAASVVSKKFNASVLALFAALAGVLTLVGVYGLMASWVAESRQEFGVRLALGAERRELLSMVMGRGLRLTAAGVILGLPMAVVASRSVRALLFEVAAGDAITFAGASAVLLTVGVAGSYFPARRAVSVNPVDSLRAG
jgi:ABC-type antimicrobial peptide transport system permease subunit